MQLGSFNGSYKFTQFYRLLLNRPTLQTAYSIVLNFFSRPQRLFDNSSATAYLILDTDVT